MDRRGFLVSLGALGLVACTGERPELGAAEPSAPPPTLVDVAPVDPASTTFPPNVITRGPVGVDGVALTFHVDGDPALARELLAVLGARSAPMTAFVIGRWLEANPAYAELLAAGGHDVANHTYSHPDMPTMTPSAIGEEIERCAVILERLTGSRGRWFRPSATDEASAVMVDQAALAGYEATIGFNVDPLDYRDPGADAIVEVCASATGGDIVSLHFGHVGTVEALPRILDDLEVRGLRPVTMAEMVTLI